MRKAGLGEVEWYIWAVVRYSDFDHVDQTEDAGAQNEAFFAGIIEAFQTAGRFLDLRALLGYCGNAIQRPQAATVY